jgi:very-short-patch-repair endonuclease
MIESERRIWSHLRGRQVDGWTFRRQHPIGPYFVDFYCPAAKLVIEFNGASHDDDQQWVYDKRRQAWLEAQGYRVLNLNYETEQEQLDDLIEVIWAHMERLEAEGVIARPRASPRSQWKPPSGASGATSPRSGEEMRFSRPTGGGDLRQAIP